MLNHVSKSGHRLFRKNQVNITTDVDLAPVVARIFTTIVLGIQEQQVRVLCEENINQRFWAVK